MANDHSNSVARLRKDDELVDLLLGSIANKFIPESEPSPTVYSNQLLLMPHPPVSPDCGTYGVTCPWPTQDPANCPTVDTGSPSCGLCPDTQVPPAGQCHPGDSTGIYCAPPGSDDCGTFSPPDTYDLCETPDTVHHVRCILGPH
jgi:hypothetical protein